MITRFKKLLLAVAALGAMAGGGAVYANAQSATRATKPATATSTADPVDAPDLAGDKADTPEGPGDKADAPDAAGDKADAEDGPGETADAPDGAGTSSK